MTPPPSLQPDEARVLGTLVEKAQTTPNQYPLTLNGLVVGVNQKNNRSPVVELDEERVLRALDGLRAKGLVREVSLTGSRVEKYRHVARETLAVGTSELVLLAELLLRGPQTSGELRTRASRMHPLESIETVEAALAGMGARTPPLVREMPPSPGTRAPRWVQLLSEGLHPLDAPAERCAAEEPRGDDRLAALERRVAALESELASLRSALGA